MKDLYNKIIEAAKVHGEESDPDHEVGDLQDTLQICMELMTDEQLRTLETNWTETRNT